MPFVVNAVVRGGAAIMKIYNSKDGYDVSLKSDKTPITDADRAAHTVIKECLGPTRIPILSEEGREMLYDERRSWELFWLVDPLDGTVEFINNTNEFTVNIALMYEGRAIGGVIYVPYLERLYFATEGSGAYRCDDVKWQEEQELSHEQLRAMGLKLPIVNEPRERQRVAVSRSHNTPETYDHIDKLRATTPDLELVEQGSSYKFCMLAEGAVDYYVRTSSTCEWDTAAGELILAEAGGTTRSLEGGEPLKYNKEELHNPWFECRSAVSKM